MKEIAQGSVDSAGLTYDAKLEDGKLEIALSVDLGKDLSDLEAKLASPLIKSALELLVGAIKAL